MNNYYFTASKWYGPLEMIDPDFIKHKTPKHEKVYLDKWNNRIQELLSKGPSGDSLIPEFAGMVKEEGKDFAFEIHWNRNKGRSMPTHADLDKIAVPLEEKQTAVPVAEEIKIQLCEGEDDIAFDFHKANAEEGKQTFSEEERNNFAIGFAEWMVEERYTRSEYRLGKWYKFPFKENDNYFTTKELLTEYLKTKQ